MTAPRRVFQFALYGRAGTGKTSFLAAMAMPHASRDGVACTWRCAAVDVPRPPGPEDEWAAGDPAVAAYRGAEWLREAIGAFDAGGVLKSNRDDTPALRLRFDLKDGGVEYPVEVIDYSGELIDPETSAEEIAASLRKHLLECDGLLVLAEAPRPGAAVGSADGLLRLQQAFAVLSGGAGRPGLPADTGVAMVVNKWDRRGTAAGSVEEFLDGPDGAAHRGLRDALRTADPTGFRAFAASAFGRSLTDDDAPAERPTTERPLPSFGLEEPFLWAARRRRTLDGDRAVERVRARFEGQMIPDYDTNLMIFRKRGC